MPGAGSGASPCTSDASCTAGQACQKTGDVRICTCSSATRGTDVCEPVGTCVSFCSVQNAFVQAVNALVPRCTSEFDTSCGTGTRGSLPHAGSFRCAELAWIIGKVPGVASSPAGPRCSTRSLLWGIQLAVSAGASQPASKPCPETCVYMSVVCVQASSAQLATAAGSLCVTPLRVLSPGPASASAQLRLSPSPAPSWTTTDAQSRLASAHVPQPQSSHASSCSTLRQTASWALPASAWS